MAAQALDIIAENADALDQHLLSVIGEGHGYEKAASTLGQTASSLRSRMSRLRGKYTCLKL